MRRILAASVLAGLVLAGVPGGWAQVAPLDNRDAAIAGTDRLVAIQNPDGSFPWYVGDPGVYQNVQGITAMGLLEGFKVSGDDTYIERAALTRNWLAAYRSGASPPRLMSAPNIFFLAEYALLSLNTADVDLARAALNDRIAQFGSPQAVITGILQARVAQGHANLGIWDGAFYVRAAQDVGFTDVADAMADTLATQTIVNPFDSAANWYEFGLSGLLLGLSEADLVGHRAKIEQAAAALKARQNPNSGSFPATFGGVSYADDTQSTAYATLALLAVGELDAGLRGADFLNAMQRPDGSFRPAPGDASEYGEVDSEAVMALAAGTLLVPNGVLAYADSCSVVATNVVGASVGCRVNL